MKPRVFIGSSLESLEFARAVQENLSRDAEVTVWDQGLFAISSYILDTLFAALSRFDFAVFVFSPDDVIRIKGKKFQAVRDNVIFELGLFIGRLGREKSFLLIPEKVDNLRLPSDLMGVVYSTFDPSRSDGNLIAAMGPACNQIRKAISGMRRTSSETAEAIDHLQALYLSTYQIYHQFYDKSPEIEVLDHKYEFSIDSSGNSSCREVRSYLVRQGEYSVDLFGFHGDVPLDSFRSLDLRVSCSSRPDGVVALPARDLQNQKKFAIFFLPPIREGEQVDFMFEWKWPFIWRRLVQGGQDNWSGRPKASYRIRRMEFSFIVPAEMPPLTLRNIGQGGGELVVNRGRIKSSGKVEYRFVIPDLGIGKQYNIELRPTSI